MTLKEKESYMQLKQNYSIKKSLLRLLPFLMLAGAPSCKKQPLPEPEPYDVVIDWNWDDQMGWAPPVNNVKKYTDNPYVETVYIKLVAPNSSGLTPRHFKLARAELQKCLDLKDNVRGDGTIFVSRTNGAQLADTAQYPGMARSDSIWFTNNGWMVQRLPLIR